MSRYSLRTLLMLLAMGPPLAARAWWTHEETFAALSRTPPEAWIQLLGLTIATIVVAAEFRRRALV